MGIKILIGCEFSGKLRNCFSSLGCDAWSCDLLPSLLPGNHYQCDVLDIIHLNWDLAIFHPPCDYLSNAGNSSLNVLRWGDKAIQREKNRYFAADFFFELYNSNIPHICIENPVGLINRYLKPSQIISPYLFGDFDAKRTCLWLKNLPHLIYNSEINLFNIPVSNPRPLPSKIHPSGKKSYFTENCRGSRASVKSQRSITFDSIADAMACQWYNYLLL
jgi:hypothetical protein